MIVTLVLQTAAITSLRLVLFLGCRKYLLRAIYHDILPKDLRNASPGESESTTTKLSFFRDGSAAAAVAATGDEGDEEGELNGAPLLPVHGHLTSAGAGYRSDSLLSSSVSSGPGKTEPHAILSRNLFSVCFEESCVLFVLLMCEGGGIMESRARMINWNFSLLMMLCSIVVFIPLSFSLVLTYWRSASVSLESRSRRRSWVVRTLLTVAPVLAYLFMLSYVPLPAAISSTTAGTAAIMSRLVVVGTVILGSLSGFGCVNTAWRFLPLAFTNQRTTTDGDISASEQALARIRSDLVERRNEFKRRESSQSQKESWLAKVSVNFRGSTELSALGQELEGLEALEYQMAKNLEMLRQRRGNAKFSGTWKGRLVGIGGRLFAVYCVFRIISSLVNIIFPVHFGGGTSTSSDLVTQLLVYCVSLVPSVHMELDEISSVARQISLGLVGVIILSSIRLVLTGVGQVLRVTNRKLGASLMLLLLAQLMGLYLLSTLIQLRTSFPSNKSSDNSNDDGSGSNNDNLFSTLPEYVVFGGMFDGSFLIAAVGTGVVKWFGERISGGDV